MNFREACGGEYLNNSDVSPLRVPRKLVEPMMIKSSAEVLTSYISFANRAFEFGYLTFRRYILEQIYRYYTKSDDLVYSVDGKRGIQSFEDCTTNYRLHSRFNSSLFRKEYKGLIFVSVPFKKAVAVDKKIVNDDTISLFEWYRLHPRKEIVNTTILDRGRVDIRPNALCVKQRWQSL